MSKIFWLHGIRFVLQSDTDEAVPNLMKAMPAIKGDILSMRASYGPDTEISNWRRQGRWDIQELGGVVTVKIHSVPIPAERGKEEKLIPPEGYDHCLVVECLDDPKIFAVLIKAKDHKLQFYGWITSLTENQFDPPGKKNQPSHRSEPWAYGFLPDLIEQVGRVDQGYWAYSGYGGSSSEDTNWIYLYYDLSTRLGRSDAERTTWVNYPIDNRGIDYAVDTIPEGYWSHFWEVNESGIIQACNTTDTLPGVTYNDQFHMNFTITRGSGKENGPFAWWYPVGLHHNMVWNQTWWVEFCALTAEDFDLLWDGSQQVDIGLQAMLGPAILPSAFSQWEITQTYDEIWWMPAYGSLNDYGYLVYLEDRAGNYHSPFHSWGDVDGATRSGNCKRCTSFYDGVYVSGREHEIFITGYVNETIPTNSGHRVSRRNARELDTWQEPGAPAGGALQEATADEKTYLEGNEGYGNWNVSNPFYTADEDVWTANVRSPGIIVVNCGGTEYPIREETAGPPGIDTTHSWVPINTVKFWDWGIFSAFNAGVSKDGIKPDEILELYCFAAITATTGVGALDDYTDVENEGEIPGFVFFGLIDPREDVCYMSEDFDGIGVYANGGISRVLGAGECTIDGKRCAIKCRVAKLTRTDPAGEITYAD